jgi:hypothetical protein
MNRFLFALAVLGALFVAAPASADYQQIMWGIDNANLPPLISYRKTPTTWEVLFSDGVLTSSHGGAGTVSGLLQADGAGNVSAADLLDLTNVAYAAQFPGIDPTGATDSAAGINALEAILGALAPSQKRAPTIVFGPGTFLLQDQVNLLNGQIIQCAGINRTVFLVDAGFNMLANGVFQLGTGEPGAVMKDCAIRFVQPSAVIGQFSGSISGTTLTWTSGATPSVGDVVSGAGAVNGTRILSGSSPTYAVSASQTVGPATFDLKNRSALTQYPPALYANNVPRFVLDHVQIEGAWKCANFPGNDGGAVFRDFWCGGINTAGNISIDGSLDFITGLIRCFPWGHDLQLYMDQQTVCLELGRADGWTVSVHAYSSAVKLTASYQGGEFPTLNLDGPGSYISGASSGSTYVGGGYIAQGINALNPGVRATGLAAFHLSNMNMVTGGTVTAPVLYAGDSGSTGALIFANFINMLVSGSSASTSSMQVGSGGRLLVNNSNFQVSSADVRTIGTIRQTSGGLVAQNNTFTSASGGSGPVISVAADSAEHVISGNRLNGWSVALPFATSLGYYDIATPYTGLTPTLAFATPGDSSFTLNSSSATYWRMGDFVKARVALNFTTNGYTTASGALSVSGFGLPTPFTATNSGCAWNTFQNVTFTTPIFPRLLSTGVFNVAVPTSAGAMGTADVTNFLASTSNIVLDATCDYRVR